MEHRDELARLAGERQGDLDAGIAAWRAGAGSGVRLWCAPGCGNCCTLAVNATLPEALAIAGGLDESARLRLGATVARILNHARDCPDPRTFLTGYRAAVGPCPFLDAAASCSIYAVRPLACRALLATRPADWCGVNLAEVPAIEREPFLASLDRAVVAWPTHYAAYSQQLAAAIEQGLLLAMLRCHGFALSGCLPLLVWLAGRPGFAEAVSAGPDGCRAFLQDSVCLLPFLIQITAP